MFYGWKLSGMASLGNFVLQGSLLYLMNAFLEPLTALYGWSRADISLVMSVAAIGGALSTPFLSTLSLHISLRALMTGGALFGGLSVVILGWTDNYALFCIAYTTAWIGGQAFGGVIGNILMNKWFERYQGRAFGLCNVGTSLSGAFMPFVLLLLIDHYDVRTAWTAYGLIVMGLAPLCWMVVRDTPEEMGLLRDNMPGGATTPRDQTEIIPLRTLLHTPSVFLVGFSFGCLLMVSSSVMSQLKPRLVDAGLSSYVAMALMCSAALCAALAKYIWGWLCDRNNPVHVARLLLFCNVLSLSLVFLPQSLMSALLFVVLFGICCGGGWTLLPTVVAYCFGKNKFTSTYRIIVMFVLMKGVGYPILGYSYALTGSYDAAFMAYVGILCFCLALLCLLPARPHDFGGGLVPIDRCTVSVSVAGNAVPEAPLRSSGV